jgi:hypothetical protein
VKMVFACSILRLFIPFLLQSLRNSIPAESLRGMGAAHLEEG